MGIDGVWNPSRVRLRAPCPGKASTVWEAKGQLRRCALLRGRAALLPIHRDENQASVSPKQINHAQFSAAPAHGPPGRLSTAGASFPEPPRKLGNGFTSPKAVSQGDSELRAASPHSSPATAHVLEIPNPGGVAPVEPGPLTPPSSGEAAKSLRGMWNVDLWTAWLLGRGRRHPNGTGAPNITAGNSTIVR